MKNEQVLSFALASLSQAFDLPRQYWRIDQESLNALDYAYESRKTAETNFARKQLIVYALVFNAEGSLLTYERRGSEGRLAGRLSAGIGGHVNDSDAGGTLSEKALSGLLREMREETGLALAAAHLELLGMINEDESQVGRCHIGAVYRVRLGAEQRPVFARELANPCWNDTARLDLARFELWSALALRLAEQGNERPFFF